MLMLGNEVALGKILGKYSHNVFTIKCDKLGGIKFSGVNRTFFTEESSKIRYGSLLESGPQQQHAEILEQCPGDRLYWGIQIYNRQNNYSKDDGSHCKPRITVL